VSAPTYVYPYGLKKAYEALLALGTPKLMIATDTWVPSQTTNDFANDITNEVTGTGYTAGGVTLTGVVLNFDTSALTVTLDANDVSGLSVTGRWGVLIVSTGTLSTSPVVGLVDFSEGLGGNVTIIGDQWDSLGILQFAFASMS
jgi:hypothetical protein